MLLPSAASSLLLFTIGPKKRQNDLVSVNKLESKKSCVTQLNCAFDYILILLVDVLHLHKNEGLQMVTTHVVEEEFFFAFPWPHHLIQGSEAAPGP